MEEARPFYRRPAPLTFKSYAETWFAEAERRRQWTPNSVKGYRAALARIEKHFGQLRLGDVRPRHVAAFVAAALDDYAPATVGLDVGVIHDVFASAVREELVSANPATSVERPKVPEGRWKILTPAEIARVATAFEDVQLRTMFLVLTRTGLRRHELRALRWRDVDFVDELLRVERSKSKAGERSIALSASLMEALWQWRRATSYAGDDELVFVEEGGRPVSVARWSETFETALAEAGITEKVRPFHDLRPPALTNAAAAGASPIGLMTSAGHSNMGTTKRYLQLAGVVFRDEAEALERRLGAVPQLSTGLSEPEESERQRKGGERRIGA